MVDLGEKIRKIAYGAFFGLAFVAILSLSGCERQPAQIACTEEAMLCPDGITAVGRTGPNCEFAACPAQDCSGGCPQYMPPAPGWCSDGKIVDRGKNACGCQLPPKCEQVYCTMDALLCPDGITSVGRIPPDCGFAACPEAPAQAEPVACTMEALLCPGTADIFVGRQAPYCLFSACPTPKDKCDIKPEGTGAYMPNPAAFYCVNIGGESMIKTADDGSQYGICKWNSIEFEEWDLFRKNCQ